MENSTKLKDRRILLGVTGGIAAYKAVELASLLTRSGASVKTILTENATRFVTPLTFSAVTRDLVTTDMFALRDPTEHVTLADWADLLVIAPATANMIGKLANGIADDLLSTCAMAHYRPKLVVPAMNVHMFENPALKANLDRLSGFGWRIMPPETGRLACGYVGEGRMPDPAEITWWVRSVLTSEQDLSGMRVLVTAGACRESLDPVRFLSNRSSGRMGLALARAAAIRGASVTLIHGALDVPLPHYIQAVHAESAAAMREALAVHFEQADVLFMAAAVTDFTPAEPAAVKRPKSESLDLRLDATPDLLAELGQRKGGRTVVGFAMESERIAERGRDKLIRKHCDFLAANPAEVAGSDDTGVEWLSPDGAETLAGDKFTVAHRMLDRVLAHRNRA